MTKRRAPKMKLSGMLQLTAFAIFWVASHGAISTLPLKAQLKETMNIIQTTQYEKCAFPAKGRKVVFALFKKVKRKVVKSLNNGSEQLLFNGLLDCRQPLKVGIHGWLQTMDTAFVKKMKKAYLRGKRNNQVIIVRWFAANQPFIGARLALNDTATTIYNFLERITSETCFTFDQITVIGHSLGAQLAGTVGNKAGGRIGKIIALDPAYPTFWDLSSESVHRMSAKWVVGVHTNPGFYGADWNVGHVDFWPNYGKTPQPPCSKTPANLSEENQLYRRTIHSDVPEHNPNELYMHFICTTIEHDKIFYFGTSFLKAALHARITPIGQCMRERTYNGVMTCLIVCSHEYSIELFFQTIRHQRKYKAQECDCITMDSCKSINKPAKTQYFNEFAKKKGQYCFETR